MAHRIRGKRWLTRLLVNYKEYIKRCKGIARWRVTQAEVWKGLEHWSFWPCGALGNVLVYQPKSSVNPILLGFLLRLSKSHLIDTDSGMVERGLLWTRHSFGFRSSLLGPETKTKHRFLITWVCPTYTGARSLNGPSFSACVQTGAFL